jgi:hypothetical protein
MDRQQQTPAQLRAHALDELYAVDPVDFAAKRKELVGRLREAGFRGEAEELSKRRKPTLAAWTANQLVRERRKEVRELVKSGARLRRLQERIVAGKRAEGLDEAVGDVRDAIRDLTRAAERIARDGGQSNTDAVAERVHETLFAAVAEESRSDELLCGRLTKEWQSSGFGFTEAALSTAPTRGKSGPAKSSDRQQGLQKKKQHRLGEARMALTEAKKELSAKEAEFRQAQAQARRAEREVEKAQRV